MNEEESVNPFGISTKELVLLNESKDVNRLNEMGGVVGLAEALHTNLKDGFLEEEPGLNIEERRRVFGKNEYPQPAAKSLLFYILESLKDTMLIILIIAATLMLIVGLLATFLHSDEDNSDSWTIGPGCRSTGDSDGGGKNEWIDSVGIFAAIILVTSVSSFNNWSKDRQFRSLNKVKDDKKIKVIRNGTEQEVSIMTLVVGDLVRLESGDQVPADGIFVEGFSFKTDESVMTGETDLVKHNEEDPFMLSGCQVAEGVATMLVTAVGVNTEWGKTMANLDRPNEDTPLQEKLESLAKSIGFVGICVAVLDFSILLILFCVKTYTNWQGPKEKFKVVHLVSMLRFAVIGVTIVVVAIPEGLPLAVTISLAYSMKKMMKDNNLVRHLAACETMGGATTICSDKTGTLTTNRMEVVEGFFGGKKYTQVPNPDALDKTVYQLLCDAIAVNSNANLNVEKQGPPDFIGNKTECGMLYMLYKSFREDYKAIRLKYERDVCQVYTFSSDRKRMSTVLKTGDNTYRIFCKGASEIVLGLCDNYLDEHGELVEISESYRVSLEDEITKMASRGLRTIAITYKDFTLDDPSTLTKAEFNPEEGMNLISVVGIKDPLRPEVIDAVARCKRSGIFVRMVTGDNILTAQHIARECGILSTGIAMLGKDFRVLNDEGFDEVLPKLQVLARSTPTDKLLLVNELKKRRQVVAVTGDGTNDAAALKAANVGLSMGLSGTEVAKEASDIIILDDNFRSIVMTVKWGRSVYENIRKFLQFQVTINFVALTVTFIGSITTLGFPLTPVQLLWVNLIMDTFAALALATEPPSDELLERKPYGKDDPLITTNMWKCIVGQGLYQIAVLFFLMYGFDVLVPRSRGKYWSCRESPNDFTMLFNTFVICQLFNEVNCRKINDERNVFKNLHNSYVFISIWLFTIGFQAIIVQFGGGVAQTTGLEVYEWMLGFVIGSVSLPLGFLLRLVHLPELQEIYFKRKRVEMKHVDDEVELREH